MQTLTNISIPEPCHQNWNDMMLVQQGRHCRLCQKNVVDFTQMTNSEIISYLSQSGKACGRFLPQQLSGVKYLIQKKESRLFSWKGLAIAAAISSIFTNTNAIAQPKVNTVQSVSNKPAAIPSAVRESITYVTLKGRIIDADSKMPIPVAMVGYDTRAMNTITDTLGNFTVKVPDTVKWIKIASVGYEGINVPVSKFSDGTLALEIKLTAYVMGEVVVVKRPGLVKRCWNKVKKPFKSH